jgi:hypothetical protein
MSQNNVTTSKCYESQFQVEKRITNMTNGNADMADFLVGSADLHIIIIFSWNLFELASSLLQLSSIFFVVCSVVVQFGNLKSYRANFKNNFASRHYYRCLGHHSWCGYKSVGNLLVSVFFKIMAFVAVFPLNLKLTLHFLVTMSWM